MTSLQPGISTSSNTLHAPANDSGWWSFWGGQVALLSGTPWKVSQYLSWSFKVGEDCYCYLATMSFISLFTNWIIYFEASTTECQLKTLQGYNCTLFLSVLQKSIKVWSIVAVVLHIFFAFLLSVAVIHHKCPIHTDKNIRIDDTLGG